MRASPRFRALRIPPDEVRGRGESLQILGCEGRLPIGT